VFYEMTVARAGRRVRNDANNPVALHGHDQELWRPRHGRLPPPPDAATVIADIADVEAFIAEVRVFLGKGA
jgi:hypothetical protein